MKRLGRKEEEAAKETKKEGAGKEEENHEDMLSWNLNQGARSGGRYEPPCQMFQWANL